MFRWRTQAPHLTQPSPIPPSQMSLIQATRVGFLIHGKTTPPLSLMNVKSPVPLRGPCVILRAVESARVVATAASWETESQSVPSATIQFCTAMTAVWNESPARRMKCAPQILSGRQAASPASRAPSLVSHIAMSSERRIEPTGAMKTSVWWKSAAVPVPRACTVVEPLAVTSAVNARLFSKAATENSVVALDFAGKTRNKSVVPVDAASSMMKATSVWLDQMVPTCCAASQALSAMKWMSAVPSGSAN